MVTSSNPTTIQQAIRLAHKLTDQAITQGTLPPRRFEPTKNFNQSTSSGQSQGGYAGKHPKCNKCGLHHSGACERQCYQRCGKTGHAARDCKGDLQPKQTFQQPGSTKGERSNAVMGIISFMKAQKCLRKGHTAILALVAEQPSEEKRIEDIPIVRDYPEVFPEHLPGLPPHRQVEFQIDLAPGAAPIARAPYRLAPSELQELSTQLQELLNKGFIRPSSSAWGAPVLCVKKKDGTFRMCIHY
ncbi:hypothetical protein L1987_15645 [Smallanthus sonchifolius]|uniref:Uncharacterized protein n=1 Tax=Smallanthus sonchifolius TaxID=185202 RepID=A0ACB9J760_9ASTR|nr:hypothetical protein L1987_15645 [Smallanthus sonchifolius]